MKGWMIGVAAMLGVGVAVSAWAEGPTQSLTVYSDTNGEGFAVVREVRRVELAKGRNTVRFDNVAATIDGTSVAVQSLSDPSTSVLEQTFAYDLVSTEKLLERYLGQGIGVWTKDGRLDGTLLSYDDKSLVLQTADKAAPVQVVARDQNMTRVVFGELPGGLIVKPSLLWLVEAAKAGAQDLRVSYQAGRLGWSADYSLVLDAKETAGAFSGWATLTNNSGASFKDVQLKLVAGDVQRVAPAMGRAGRMAKVALMAMDGEGRGFEEQSLFEYHLYTLPRPTSLPQNAVKQIELFDAAPHVGLRKVLAYYGAPGYWSGSLQNDRDLGTSGNTKVDVYIEMKNKADNGLGLPLPKGRVRVFKENAKDGTLEFVGEDRLDHTAKDETVLLKLGQAFDVVGEHKQTEFVSDKKNIRESFQITLKNHKNESVHVLVKENLYRWSNWEIERKSDAFSKADSRTILFDVEVPANGEKVVTYTAHYFGW